MLKASSFQHAFRGIKYTFALHPNIRFHTLVATAVLILGWFVGLSHLEWLIIIFTILLVFMAEMVNTAIESMTDLITTEYHQQAKIAKDVAAGMVILTALGAIIIGLAIFLPYIQNY